MTVDPLRVAARQKGNDMNTRLKIAGAIAATLCASYGLTQTWAQSGTGQTGSGQTGSSQTGQPGHAGQTGQVGQVGSAQAGHSVAQSATGGADQQVQAALRQIQQSPDQAPEKLFVLMAAMGNAWETEFSRLVEQRVQDNEIKQIAHTVLQDHQQAQQRLQEVARQLDLQLPQGLTSEKQQKLQIFQSMSPGQLQTCYIVDLKADHAKDISSFADHRQTLKNPQITQYIDETLPKLRQHGAHLRQVAMSKQIGDSSSALGNTDLGTNRDLERRSGSVGTDSTGPGATGTGSDATGSGSSGATGSGSTGSTGSTGSGSTGSSGSGSTGTGGQTPR